MQKTVHLIKNLDLMDENWFKSRTLQSTKIKIIIPTLDKNIEAYNLMEN